MKRVLVTGATGFCGRHLSNYLHQCGYQVIGTYLHPVQRKNSKYPGRLIPLDIESFEKVLDLVRTLRPDFICHLAAQSSVSVSWQTEEKTFLSNTFGVINILEAIRQASKKTKLLFASSCQVYGRSFESNRKLDEDDLLLPDNPYAASKALAELACLNFYSKFKANVVIARAFNHTGPGQTEDFVFSSWCKQIALLESQSAHKKILNVGNVKVRRDFLNVHDVVRAYELLLRKGVAGQAYNICTGKALELKRYLEYLIKKSQVSINVLVQKKRVRSFDMPVIVGSCHKLAKLGWKPKASVFEALDGLLQDWREQIYA